MQDSKYSDCSQPDDVRCFLHGRYCQRCARFDENRFLENRYAPVFILSSLLGKYVKMFYQVFDRDLVMALVMCEIWHYNFSRYFDRNGQENNTAALNDPVRRRQLLPPCNAYSISQVLGVPNETVRRKIRKLVEHGWVENDNGELIASIKLDQFFCPSHTIETMREFVSAARHILAMLEGSPENPPTFQSK